MKNTFLLVTFIVCSSHLYATDKTDSLLKVLDKTVFMRTEYAEKEELKIRELKQKREQLNDPDELYAINREIILQYETFICDSAKLYINENMRIATNLGNEDYLSESKIDLAFIYSLSGLFTQAIEILDAVEFERLPQNLKIFYCWTFIRYYENLIKYTEDAEFSANYHLKKEAYRDTVMRFLSPESEEYAKEKAFKYQEAGEYQKAIDILTPIFQGQDPGTHAYAMEAMSLAKIYKLVGDRQQEEYYLCLAAITDVQLAVKENEALLSLAIHLYEDKDIDRSYNYIKAALDDANFYNSRFRNTIIARIQPIIENTYLLKIEQQQRNLQLYALLTSLFVVVLAIALYFIYRQIRTVSKARKKLIQVNNSLDEANLIKEKYIGYFMNQCAVYINKLDEYRKNVNRKIKTGQIDDLYRSSSHAMEKEIEELYVNFDNAFLELYPDFVKEFNSLLKPEDQFKLEKNHLNTELRIFALIRLGITDVNKIAVFLHYSMQTIYNYKSKVKGKSLIGGEQFEEEVMKIGSLSLKKDSI